MTANEPRDIASARARAAVQLAQNPDDEQAWLLLGHAADTPEARGKYLRRVLQINPRNREARQGLSAQAQAPAGARWRTLGSWLAFALSGIFFVLVAVGIGPALLGERTFVVMSGSMEPAIPAGAVAIAKPVAVSELHIGNVIVFLAGANATLPTIHRIVGVREQAGTRFFTTRGDANPTADTAEVSLPPTAWVVENHLPWIGYVLRFATSREGVAALIGVPLVFLAGMDLLAWLQRRRKLAGWSVGPS